MPSQNKIYNFLRWSEKYTKTNMVYLASGGFWLMIARGIQMALGLFLLVAFANLIPKEIYGTYKFIISLAGIVGVFTLTGMGSAVMRSASRGERGSLRSGFRVQIKWSVGIVIAASAVSFYHYLNNDFLIAKAMVIAGAFVPLISGFGLSSEFLIGKQAFREKALTDIFGKFIPSISLLPTLFLTDDPLIIIFIYFTSNVVALFLIYLFVNRKYPEKVVLDSDLSNYSKHLSVMVSVSKISNYIDSVLIWKFLGPASVATYAIAQIPIIQTRSLFMMIHHLTFPKIARKSLPELKQILPIKMGHYFLVVVLVVSSYIIAAPFLFTLLFPAYTEGVFYSQLLALSLLVIPRTLIEQTFTAHKMKQELYILNISTPMIRIILLAILIPFYGIYGAILAFLFTELYTTGLQWYLFKKAKTS